MEYIQANTGRIFIVRFDDGEDILEKIRELIVKENIKAGMVNLLGALCDTRVVLGPEKKEYPPKPIWHEFAEPKEVIGFGMFAWEGDVPKLHIHAGIGHSKDVFLGCIREKSKVYLTIEAVIQEIIAPSMTRKLDERYNAATLRLS